MPELKALAREHSLRGYSQLRKAELIALLQNNVPEARAPRRQRPLHPNRSPPPPLQSVLRVPLMKCQLKRR